MPGVAASAHSKLEEGMCFGSYGPYTLGIVSRRSEPLSPGLLCDSEAIASTSLPRPRLPCYDGILPHPREIRVLPQEPACFGRTGVKHLQEVVGS